MYARWLVARGNMFLPAAASIAKLVERLEKEGWIPGTGGHAIKTVENTFDDDDARGDAGREPLPPSITKDWLDEGDREELRLVWPLEGDAAKYALSQSPAGRAAWTLEIHRADEYVVPTASTIGALPTICNCKEDLAFAWDEDELVPAFGDSTGIFAECEECSRTFEPGKVSAILGNPFDGSTEEVFGGAAYRFALVVRCEEPPVRDPKLTFAKELVALVENEFGRSFYEFASLT